MANKSASRIIQVTGFDVFNGFETSNPSWAAVSLLPDTIQLNGQSFSIQKHKVPVTYSAVDAKIDELWTNRPVLMVHCGAHSSAKNIYLEKNAHNRNFVSADWHGQCLANDRICLPNSGANVQQLSTKLNLDNIVVEADENLFQCSDDPGSYLCGYIYLKSLDIDADRSVFIHVPRICEKFTAQTISDGILFVIKKCLKQLDEKNVL